MSEEYIYPGGFSSLDIEVCDNCYEQFCYMEMTKANGEQFCKKCFEEMRSDHIRDERKDERFE